MYEWCRYYFWAGGNCRKLLRLLCRKFKNPPQGDGGMIQSMNESPAVEINETSDALAELALREEEAKVCSFPHAFGFSLPCLLGKLLQQDE